MIELLWPWVWLCLPLPLLIRLLPAHRDSATGGALRVPFFADWSAPAPSGPSRGSSDHQTLYWALLIWLLLLAAASRPQWVGDPVALPQTGRDLMLAVDISESMEYPDFELNGRQATRLQTTQEIAGEFLRRREGDRLGLILFGTRAYLQSPLTFDRFTVATLLQEAEIGLAGGKTAIGDAIGLAIKRLKDRPAQARVLILLSDGANTAGALPPQQALTLAKQAGLKIHTIGIGAESLEVQGLFGTRQVNPSADLDEALLTRMAEETGGHYFRARDQAELERIYHEIDALEPLETDPQLFRPIRTLYHWPLALATLLTLLLALRGQWQSSRRPSA